MLKLPKKLELGHLFKLKDATVLEIKETYEDLDVCMDSYNMETQRIEKLEIITPNYEIVIEPYFVGWDGAIMKGVINPAALIQRILIFAGNGQLEELTMLELLQSIADTTDEHVMKVYIEGKWDTRNCMVFSENADVREVNEYVDKVSRDNFGGFNTLTDIADRFIAPNKENFTMTYDEFIKGR